MARSKRITLADVATAAGVSSATASLVLSGRARDLRISEAVQQRVRATADELGYRPNIVSVGLSTGTSRTLGFVSDTVATSRLAGDLIQGALSAALDHGFMLFTAESGGDPATERRLLEAMLDRQVDGILLASMFTHLRVLPDLLDQVPAVLLNTLSHDATPIPSVVPDELEAGRAAARMLLEAGHREIHLVGAGPSAHDVPPGTVAGRERLAGITEVLAAEGLEPATGHRCLDWIPPEGWRATRDLVDSWGVPRALICFNDRLAFGAYQALGESGLRVPDDVSVVSFDDSQLAEWLRPGLSSLAIPHYDMGRRAVDLLVSAVERRRDGTSPVVEIGPGTVHRLPMPLADRASVAAARPRAPR
ncbi:LacI family DNA-binding transcriptional regulator [Angustibacter speluncae]